MGAVLPFLMGGMGWLLAGPATAGLPFSHAPLSICCAATMLAGMMLFFLPRLFRWDWNIRYFGLASLQLASVSLPGVIPWLCIVVYSKAGFWLRAGVFVIYALPAIWWCFRFVAYYAKVMADKSLRNSIYVEESDAVYYLQKNDNWLLQHRFKFSQIPNIAMIVLMAILPFVLYLAAHRISAFLGAPFMNLFMAILFFPFVLLSLGIATRGYLIFYRYPGEIRRRSGKAIYVDMVSRTVHQSKSSADNKENRMYSELINLLACHGLGTEEVNEAAEQIASAPEDPEYEWTRGDASMAIASELVATLYEFAAVSDKADEMHEQIQDMFDAGFPDFPDASEADWNAAAYFQWLDTELSQLAVDEGGYGAVMLDTGADDNMNLFVVYRKDTDRILELAAALGLTMYRPVDHYRDA